MKFGLSSYCFSARMRTGEMSLLDVMDWIAKHGGEHMEIASASLTSTMTNDEFDFAADHDLIEAVAARSASLGLPISGYAISGNFLTDSSDEYDYHMDRIKRHIEASDRLGIEYLRHDVTEWGRLPVDAAEIERAMPILAEACREIAQFAATYGITTSVENHGKFMNGSERVLRLVQLVDEPNFRTTLDIGNFLVVDEDPLPAVIRSLPYASLVQAKDFHIRRSPFEADRDWLRTPANRHLLGSILGYGNMEIPEIAAAVRNSDFDGYVSLEFEGLEDCLVGSERGFDNLRTIFGADGGNR